MILVLAMGVFSEFFKRKRSTSTMNDVSNATTERRTTERRQDFEKRRAFKETAELDAAVDAILRERDSLDRVYRGRE